MAIKFKTKQEAERYFKKLRPIASPFETRFAKIEKKQTEHETRLNNVWKVILINNLKLKG